jgi:hypothetical protein
LYDQNPSAALNFLSIRVHLAAMKKILKTVLVLFPLMLTACEAGDVQETLGIKRDAPDEFTVVSRPSLSIPPEFTLRPPRAGEAPLGSAADDQARSLLTGKPVRSLADPSKLGDVSTVETAVTPVTRSDALSGGATSLLKRAGADARQEDIRTKLQVDAATPADTSAATTLMDKISGEQKSEPTVDAAKELERLRSNKSEGKPVTQGEVPTEKQGSGSLLDRIF